MRHRTALHAWLVVKETADETWYLAAPLLGDGDVWTDLIAKAAHYFVRGHAYRALRDHCGPRPKGARVVPINIR